MTTKITIEVGKDEHIPVQVIVQELGFNGPSTSTTYIKPGESQIFYIHQNRNLVVQELQLGAA